LPPWIAKIAGIGNHAFTGPVIGVVIIIVPVRIFPVGIITVIPVRIGIPVRIIPPVPVIGIAPAVIWIAPTVIRITPSITIRWPAPS
jgi:hypothetical protein